LELGGVSHEFSVTVQAPNGERVPPIVTGTFGGADFLHSLMGEATDHISQSSVTDLSEKLKNTNTDESMEALKGILSKFKNSGGDNDDEAQANEAENFQQKSKAYNFNPDDVMPPDVQKELYDILKWRDGVYRDINAKISMIPGLSDLLENLSNALNAYVYTVLAPYLTPILSQVTTVLGEGSKEIIDSKDQYEVFDDPDASDPTHSVLSKDHFQIILNECAGKVAQVVITHAVNLIVPAWSNDEDPNRVIDQILEAFHHPYYASGNSQIQSEMFDTMDKWIGGLGQTESRAIIQQLTKESVREGKNKREGSNDENSRTSQGGYGGSQSYGNTSGGGRRQEYGSAGGDSYGQRQGSGYGGQSEGRQDYSSSGGYGNQDSYGSRNQSSGYGGGRDEAYGRNKTEESGYVRSRGNDEHSSESRQNQYGHQERSENSYGSRDESSGYGGGRDEAYGRTRNEDSGYGRSRDNAEYSSESRQNKYGREETSDYGGNRSHNEESGYGGSRRDNERSSETRQSGYGQDSYGSSRQEQQSSYKPSYGQSESNYSSGRSQGYGESQGQSYAPSYSKPESHSYGHGGDSYSSRKESSGYGGGDSYSSRQETSGYGGNSSSSRKEDSDDEKPRHHKKHGHKHDSDDEKETYGAERLNLGEESRGYRSERRGGYGDDY